MLISKHFTLKPFLAHFCTPRHTQYIVSFGGLLQLNTTGQWSVQIKTTTADSRSTWALINNVIVPINTTTQTGIFQVNATGGVRPLHVTLHHGPGLCAEEKCDPRQSSEGLVELACLCPQRTSRNGSHNCQGCL